MFSKLNKFKKIFRIVIRFLPTRFRAAIARRAVSPDFEGSKEVEVKVASHLSEVSEALGVVHDCYVKQGLMQELPSKMRISLFNLLPTTTTVIAKLGGKVVGTLSIVVKNSDQLPSDRDFATSAIQPLNGRTAEIVGLAIDPKFRGKNGKIVFSMMKYLYLICRTHLNVSMLQVAVSPNHSYLYQDLLLFKLVEKKIVRDHSVNGKKMKALYLDLLEAPNLLKRAYSQQPMKNNLYFYMTDFFHQGFVLPERYSKDLAVLPSLSGIEAEQLAHLCKTFQKKAGSDSLRSVLRVYKGEGFQNTDTTKSEYRIPTKLRVACSGGTSLNLQLFDISERGFRVIGHENFEIGQRFNFLVRVSECEGTSPIRLIALCVWKSDEVAGFLIQNESDLWSAYVQKLRNKISGQESIGIGVKGEIKHV